MLTPILSSGTIERMTHEGPKIILSLNPLLIKTVIFLFVIPLLMVLMVRLYLMLCLTLERKQKQRQSKRGR